MEKKLTAKKIIRTIENNRDYLNKYGVKKIGLFGSFAKNKNNRKSDIDIVVKFKKNTFDDYMDLKFLLEKLFRKKVDLVIEGNIKPGLEHIKKEAIYVKRL